METLPQTEQKPQTHPEIMKIAAPLQKLGLSKLAITDAVIGVRRNILIEWLTGKELEAQQLIKETKELIESKENKTTSMTYADVILKVEENIGKYKGIFTQMQTTRILFTNMADERIIKPTTLPEKRVDFKTNTEFLGVTTKLLATKKIARDLNEADNAKALEKQRYISFMNTQALIRESVYNARVEDEINRMYHFYLKSKQDVPDTQAIKESIKSFVWEGKNLKGETIKLPLPFPEVFKRTLISDDEAAAIRKDPNSNVVNPNFTQLQKNALNLVDEVFRSYDEDLKQAKRNPEIVKQLEVQAEAKKEEKKIGVDNELAIKNLVSNATPVARYVTPGKKIKEKVTVTVDNTMKNFVAITSAFLQIDMEKYKGKGAWENVSTKTMASALASYYQDNGKKFPDVIYEQSETL